MGFLKDAKTNALATEARRAREEGRRYFAPMLNTPTSHSGMTGAVGGWAEMIEGVEAEGWTLTQWAIGQDTKGRPQAYPLFAARP